MANATSSVGPAPSFDLKGQVALVTGAARGIGNSIAIALAQAGADVALGLRDIKTGGELVSAIKSIGRRAVALQMDVEKRSEITSAVAETVKQFGRIDILVYNAGIGPPNPAEDVTEADFDYTLNVNLKGTFFVSQEVGRVMIKQRGGKIIMLGSQAGFVGLPTESIYCMTKAAIHHLTKCLAVEWGKHGITVNAVAPTFIKTPGTVKWLENDAFRNDLLSKLPLGRVGETSDVSGAVVFLASPSAALITGATLLIDAGFTAQ
jgi:NAD(P)-dependent dehydrogenase (short-subunit alcohol dehydrogenase family)